MAENFQAPPTEDEVTGFVNMFRALTTYNSEERYASSSDIGTMVKYLKLDRQGDRVPAYKKYWDENFNGKIPEDEAVKLFKSLHDTANFSAKYASMSDINGDGFISAAGFEKLMEMLVVHDPNLQRASFEQFLKEADNDGTGKVSIAEAVKWIESALSKSGHDKK